MISALVEKMRQRGLLEDAIIVIASDHGESFGGHGYMQHGPIVYGHRPGTTPRRC